jgi:hypothetical protein
VVSVFDVDIFLSVQLFGISTMRYILGRGDGKQRRRLEDNVNTRMGVGWTWLSIVSTGQCTLP